MFRHIIHKFKGLFNKSYDYQKFVVIARSRTGSSLLISYLNSHPQIEAHGEIFRELGRKSSKQIWERLFTSKNKKLKYIGFKIFYYHPLNTDDRSVWDFLKNDKTIQIIHLKRENVLRTFISREIVEKTKVWKNKKYRNTTSIEDKRIEIDVDKFLDTLSWTKKRERETAKTFSNHSFTEISYEELIANPQIVMNDIFSRFGLKPAKISTKLRRQNAERIEDLVINYSQLKTGLTEVGYTCFLE